MTDKEYITQVGDLLNQLANTKHEHKCKAETSKEYPYASEYNTNYYSSRALQTIKILQELKKNYEFTSKGVFENVDLNIKTTKGFSYLTGKKDFKIIVADAKNPHDSIIPFIFI